MEKKLTEKQKRFIDFYIETANATESARRAGYSEKTAFQIGTENLKKPYIKEAIENRIKELESKRVASCEEVMRFLTSAMRGEIQEEVVVVEGEGKGFSSAKVITKQLSAHERLDAAKQLAKRFGLDKEIEMVSTDSITFIYERGEEE